VTVTIRNPLIRNQVSTDVVAGATSGRRINFVRPRNRPTPAQPAAVRVARPAATARAVSKTRVRRLRRPLRYRYSLTSIDVMFALVAEPPEVIRARDRQYRRNAVIVIGASLAVLSVAMVGLAVVLRFVFQTANSWLV
jgi:hypothetical protein